MQIEEGKFYKTRDGRKVGPMVPRYASPFHKWTAGNLGLSWGDNGNGVSTGCPVDSDLIAECSEYEVGKWYPWTGGECPVDGESVVSVMLRDGDIEAEASACSWQWGHDDCDGDIIAFRVEECQPKEERVACRRAETGLHNTEHGTCIKRDGVIDWSTWEPLE